MQQNTLTNPTKRNRKRVGRGIAAGQGKTCGRGHKGQRSRTGKKIRITFEGGQTPLFMKLPKIKGFKNINRQEYQVINVGDLEKVGSKEITLETLVKAGMATKGAPVKILGDGEVKEKFTIKVEAVSASAKEKIEKAGGKVETTAQPKKTKEKIKKTEKAEIKEDSSVETPAGEESNEK